jgi:hypothetical protein
MACYANHVATLHTMCPNIRLDDLQLSVLSREVLQSISDLFPGLISYLDIYKLYKL